MACRSAWVWLIVALAWTGVARGQAFDRRGWLADLAQIQAAFTTKYANLEWA